MSVFQSVKAWPLRFEGTGLVAEAEVMLVGGHVLVDGEAPELEGSGATDCVGGNHVALERSRTTKRRDLRSTRTSSTVVRKPDRGRILARLHIDTLVARCGKHRPGSVLGGRGATGATLTRRMSSRRGG